MSTETKNVKTEPTPEPPPETKEKAPARVKKPGRWLKNTFIFIIVAALIGTGAFFFLRPGTQAYAQTADYTYYTVEPRDITLTLSGTGSLSPADSYTVTTLISGDILSAPFEEGEIVEKDTVLYQVDNSGVATSIEQSEISLAQTRRNYEQKVKSLDDLKIKANETGDILEIFVEVGDDVTTGQTIATIRNSAVMCLEIPFSADDAEGFYIGQQATVTVDGSFETLEGIISKIAVGIERLDGNRLVKTITIDVKNPGGISLDMAATATVGECASSHSGVFTIKATAPSRPLPPAR